MLKLLMTTLVAIKTKNGIVVAADKQMTGIEKDDVIKIYELSDNLYLLGSGYVSDILYILRTLRTEIELFELNRGRKITPKELANLLTLINYFGLRNFIPRIAGFLLAGFDDKDYYIFEITPDGVIVGSESEKGNKNYLTIGSGQIFAKPILDAFYQEDMGLKEAKEVAIKAIEEAVRRDPGSGIGYDLVVITKNKVERESGPLQPYHIEKRKEVKKLENN
jgi:proteasome beta subunit